MPEALNLSIDGACRGNPGPGAIGVIVTSVLGDVLLEVKEFVGDTTHNQAEYLALIRGLEEVTIIGARRVIVHSDSELLVQQMRGRFAVRDEKLKPLHQKAWMLAARLHFQIIHVSRERNSRADALANEAVDEARPDTVRKASPPAHLKNPRLAPVTRGRHLAGLNSGVTAAASGLPFSPPGIDEELERIEGVQVSSGGIVYKRTPTGIMICLIAKGKVWALPKGRVNEGETPEQTAVREVLEETGHLAEVRDKIHEIDYWFYWRENNTLYHKTVSFFLMPLKEENVARRDGEASAVAWFPVADAYHRLTYLNEKEVLRKAQKSLKAIAREPQ